MNYFSWIVLLFGLTVLLVTFASLLWPGTLRSVDGTNTPARIFLVLLRLAIGWHCFIEGMDKLSHPDWSSEAYLREATGPLAGAYRWLAGDRLLEKLVVPDKEHVPPRLAAEYDAYAAAFVRHYGLDADKDKVARANDILEQGKSKALTWLTARTETVEKPALFPPPLKVEWTMPERIEEYRRLEAEVRTAEEKLPTSDKDLHKRYTDAKANFNKWRADLKKSYDAQFKSFKGSLEDVLKVETKPGTPATAPTMSTIPPLTGPVALPMADWGLLEWSDLAVEWTLVVVGCGLMLGLFTRLSSGVGAVLVMSFFLAMPPLPGWPESPRLEGHYLFINKTLIEVLALAALTFLPTGRWAGIDALLSALWPAHWGRRQPMSATQHVPNADVESRTPVPTA